MEHSKRYFVSVEKEELIFSAAHFITFGEENICERIHGHNYRIQCDVSGELNHHGYVMDFIMLRDLLKEIASRLDHHVLLPMHHPDIKLSIRDDEVEATFEDRRWIFPAQDCFLLPVDNTTAERLAEYIGDELVKTLREKHQAYTSISIRVDENEGQWGVCLIRSD